MNMFVLAAPSLLSQRTGCVCDLISNTFTICCSDIGVQACVQISWSILEICEDWGTIITLGFSCTGGNGNIDCILLDKRIGGCAAYAIRCMQIYL